MLSPHENPSIPGDDHTMPSPPIEWIAPHLLTPHPRQTTIYGTENVTELVEDIRTSRWTKPLVITHQNVLISGHQIGRASCRGRV